MKRKVALIMATVLMVVSLGACSSTTSSSYGTESAESENNVRNSGEKSDTDSLAIEAGDSRYVAGGI